MKYLLMGSQVYVERDDGYKSIRYSKLEKKWVDGGHDLDDSRVGFDPFEPENSPYRYGSESCMIDITSITKEEAEKIIGLEIDETELEKSLSI